MRYAVIRGARRRPVQESGVQTEPAPDSKQERSTLPPGAADEGARAFERAARNEGEETTRLRNLAAVYGIPAIK